MESSQDKIDGISKADFIIYVIDSSTALDENDFEIMEILKELHKDGRTVILITHDNEIAAQAKRVIKIRDGRIEKDSIREEE